MSFIPNAALPDKSTFAEGTTQQTPIGGEYNDSATSPASGQSAVARITPNRALHANLRNQSGTEIATSSNPVRVDPTGTTTQPVSIASLPALVAGSAVIGGVELVDSAGTNKASISAGGAVKVDGSAATQPVSGTFWQATQPVSAASLPLPSGAATAAKQPALGTAGTASADVITIQGIASMTALKVDGSAVTQPVSGTFWQSTQPVSGTVTANAGTGTFGTSDANAVAQASTTSGQSGFLELGAVTTAAPTYTTGKSSPLSLTTAGGLRVDGSAVTQPVSGTFWQSTQPVSLSTLPALVAGSATIGSVKVTDGTNTAAVKAASTAAAATDPSLVVNISPNSPALPASQSGTWTVQPGNTVNTSPWLTSTIPATSGGLSTTKLISAATTNATSVKASAGQLYNIQAFNTNASSPRYLKLYDKASAPTVGTNTPVKTLLIPSGSSGFVVEWSNGLAFATGIAFAVTGSMADADTTAIGASEVLVNIDYK